MLNQSLSKKRKSYEVLMKALMLLSVGLTAALVLFLLVYVLMRGIPNITWELLSTKPSYLSDKIGILPDILNTVYIVVFYNFFYFINSLVVYIFYLFL